MLSPGFFVTLTQLSRSSQITASKQQIEAEWLAEREAKRRQRAETLGADRSRAASMPNVHRSRLPAAARGSVPGLRGTASSVTQQSVSDSSPPHPPTFLHAGSFADANNNASGPASAASGSHQQTSVQPVSFSGEDVAVDIADTSDRTGHTEAAGGLGLAPHVEPASPRSVSASPTAVRIHFDPGSPASAHLLDHERAHESPQPLSPLSSDRATAAESTNPLLGAFSPPTPEDQRKQLQHRALHPSPQDGDSYLLPVPPSYGEADAGARPSRPTVAAASVAVSTNGGAPRTSVSEGARLSTIAVAPAPVTGKARTEADQADEASAANEADQPRLPA